MEIFEYETHSSLNYDSILKQKDQFKNMFSETQRLLDALRQAGQHWRPDAPTIHCAHGSVRSRTGGSKLMRFFL